MGGARLEVEVRPTVNETVVGTVTRLVTCVELDRLGSSPSRPMFN